MVLAGLVSLGGRPGLIEKKTGPKAQPQSGDDTLTHMLANLRAYLNSQLLSPLDDATRCNIGCNIPRVCHQLAIVSKCSADGKTCYRLGSSP